MALFLTRAPGQGIEVLTHRGCIRIWVVDDAARGRRQLALEIDAPREFHVNRIVRSVETRMEP